MQLYSNESENSAINVQFLQTSVSAHANFISCYVIVLSGKAKKDLVISSKYHGDATLFKVAPYSFLTARELVSKSRDGASFKKSTRKSRATRVTRTGRILATIVAHFQCVSHP